jgi:endonuclease/exonuclease/phosphatase family metal-dependent hydrolase
MTYNVQAPGWNQNRRKQIVTAIRAYAPDVLGLHEATRRSAGPDLLADLNTDYQSFHTSTNDPIYLLRKRAFKVLGSGVLSLGKCPLLPLGITQTLTWVKVQTPAGQQFYFYNTHLCVSRDLEGNQLQAIAATKFMASQAKTGVAHLLAGDLNANQTSGTIQYLLEKKALTIKNVTYKNPVDLDDTWQMALDNAGKSRPGTIARGGTTALDWIMTGPNTDVVAAEVIKFNIPLGKEGDFSDHLPVVTTVQLASDCANTGIFGCGTNPVGSLRVLAGVPAIGKTMTFGVDNPIGTQKAGAVPFVFVTIAPDTNFPCGTKVPGFGMAAPGAPGEFLIDLSQPTLILRGSAWKGKGIPAPIALTIPNLAILIGFDLFAQGVLIDSASSVQFGLTEAARLGVGR